VGDGPEAWGWAAATGVLWGLSYLFWRRLQATPASARPRGEHRLSGAGLDVSPWVGFALIAALTAAVTLAALELLRRGYKLRS
jgi:hypothetical protein